MNHKPSTILQILALFALLQVVLWLMGAIPGSQANVWWWTALSTLADRNGFFNVWTPYPPVFTIYHYVAIKLFAGDTEVLARYFFDGDRSLEAIAAYEYSFTAMKRVWMVFNAVFIAGQAWLVYRLYRSASAQELSGADAPKQLHHEAFIAAGAFALFNLTWRSQIVIGLGCDQFDYLPSFFYLLGLWLLIESKSSGAAVITAVGALIKIYPGLLVPLAWAKLGNSKQAVVHTAIVVALCLLAVAPFLFVNADIFLGTYQATGSRPGWESVWTYPHVQFPHMPVPPKMVGQFDVPIVDVQFTIQDGQRLAGYIVEESNDSYMLEFLDGQQTRIAKADVIHAQWLKAVETKHRILMLVTLTVLLGLTWYFRRALQTKEGLIRGALLYALVLIFFSKGISSYFILWFCPFFFILYPPLVACLMFSLFVLVGNAEFMGEGMSFYWPSIFIRQSMILGVAVEQVWRMTNVEIPNDERTTEP